MTAPDTAPDPQPTSGTDLPDTVDLRLVVADMDGTLLDGDGRVPDALWPLLERMRRRGVLLAPASGRQYANLRRMFARVADGMPFIAENGTVVVLDGEVLSTSLLTWEVVERIVATLRGAAVLHDIGLVLCTPSTAYVERHDERFLAQARQYYANLEQVDDVLATPADVIKIAVYDFGDAETGVARGLGAFRATHQVAVSGRHWVDLMAQEANKGLAVAALQEHLGISRAQTAVFGDYLNDLELMDAGDLSFAMANAHPGILATARYTAPPNTAGGVLTTVAALLDRAPRT